MGDLCQGLYEYGLSLVSRVGIMSRIARSLLAFLSVDMRHKGVSSKDLQNMEVSDMPGLRSQDVRQLPEPFGDRLRDSKIIKHPEWPAEER